MSIHIPSSVEMICEECFRDCRSLTSVTFEVNSKLSRLERYAFCESGLMSIHIPSSVEVICEGCFSECTSLKSVTFEVDSKLQPTLSSLLSGAKIASCITRPVGSGGD
jgi:predicted DsbA family dithiol-disulfide isomerase